MTEIQKGHKKYDAEFRRLKGRPTGMEFGLVCHFIKKPIAMQVETAYTQEQYDVILV